VIYALIPVKDLHGAKTRLGDALDGPARRDLVVAMYRDVLAAALACPVLDGVFVVSRDSDVQGLAKAASVRTIVPAGPSADSDASMASTSSAAGGLNADLTFAAQSVAGDGATRLLVLFADLPLANSAAIERVVRTTSDVAIVTSRDGGTNALALTSGALEFQFGPNSAAKHVALAGEAGLTLERVRATSLALDIDTIDDLEILRHASGVGEHTSAVLRTSTAAANA
jgi:2-phospho-L-lactate guanylyltransferase